MKVTAFAVACVLGLFYFVARSEAHHAFTAEFDVNKLTKLEGTVVKMEWVNPHAWLTLAVTTPDGKVEEWGAEFGAPNLLIRKGLRQTTLMPDMKVTIVGFGAA